MADTASKHEQMPDHVTVGHAFPTVEDDAEHVGQPPGGKKDQRLVRDMEPKLFRANDDEPPLRGYLWNFRLAISRGDRIYSR